VRGIESNQPSEQFRGGRVDHWKLVNMGVLGEDGSTALTGAVANGYDKIASLPVGRGVDVGVRNNETL
jgi:hypothetical protein